VEFEELAGGYSLLEAPVWDGAGGVYFSDALQGGVRRWSREGVEDVLPKRRGIGGMCLHADGGLVMTGRDVIHVRDGEQRVVLGGMDGVTGYNDFGTDEEGNVYVGALRFNPFAGEDPVPGQIWKVDSSGATPALEGVDWPNGVAVSHDGTLYACDYAHGTVLTGDGSVFARSPAAADGLALDAEGGLWVGAGQGGLARFEPDGTLDRTVDVPADFVSSMCFGGDDMRDVYVTTMGALLHARCEVPGVPVAPATV
jgi:gluconolactonase